MTMEIVQNKSLAAFFLSFFLCIRLLFDQLFLYVYSLQLALNMYLHLGM